MEDGRVARPAGRGAQPPRPLRLIGFPGSEKVALG
jgi:hypothetical protein